MSTITVKDGTTIYYKDWGKGPVIRLGTRRGAGFSRFLQLVPGEGESQTTGELCLLHSILLAESVAGDMDMEKCASEDLEVKC